MTTRPLRVAIVGAGPAGIYAADALMKSDAAAVRGVSIDLFDCLPAPFGLIRYGVAPDHPRIKEIIKALTRVLDKPQVRFFGNVRYGADLTLDDLHAHYHAVVFATGALKDRDLDIPGIDLDGSHGAADFVSWYNAHPDVERAWPLEARSVAVIGAGNVALDVARMLAKTAGELLPTEIPGHVEEGLRGNAAIDVHVFGRRGPAQAKFTPMELKELDHSPNIEVIVDPRDLEFDEASIQARRESKQVDMVADTLTNWASRDPGSRPHRLHLHFFSSPVEILGSGGRVAGLRTERTELTGAGEVRGTGEHTDWDVQAVYRAVGYYSDPVDGLPFDAASGTVPNRAGRVVDDAGEPYGGVYVTGWVKRGPVGLIGHTKGDANETIECLLEDAAQGRLAEPLHPADSDAVALLARREIAFTTWDGWYKLDAYERALGEARGRERIKVSTREEMVEIAGDAEDVA